MKIKLYILSFILLIIWLFCTSPLKPDFDPPVIGNGKKIQSSGLPIIDSLFCMYITATGTDTLKYQWYKNDTSIINAVTDTLKFDTLEYSDSGYYHCIVTNDFGADTSLKDTLILRNQAPVWLNDTMLVTAWEGITCSLFLADSCTDPESDTITFSLTPGPPEGDSIILDSIYKFTPSFNDAGVYYVKIQATDGIGTSTGILKLIVVNYNHPPEFLDSLPLNYYYVSEGNQLVISFKANDSDGDSIIYKQGLNELPRPQTVIFNDSQFVWQSNNDDSGYYTVEILATDSIATDTASITIAVGDVNRPPEIKIGNYNEGDTLEVTEMDTLSFTVTATDPDSGNVAFLLSPLYIPQSATFDTASGVFFYIPDFSLSNGVSNYVFDSVTFIATDNVNEIGWDTFFINIEILDSNSAPVWSIDSLQLAVTEGSTVTFNIDSVFQGDNEGEPVTFTTTFGAFDNDTSLWLWIPDFSSFHNSDTVCTITATDNHIPPVSSNLTMTISITDSVVPVVLSKPSNVTYKSMEITWTQSAEQQFGAYKLYYDISSNVTETSNLAADITDIFKTTYTLDNLNENTRYYFRLFTYNANGTKSGSNVVDSTTPVLNPPTLTISSPVFINDSAIVNESAVHEINGTASSSAGILSMSARINGVSSPVAGTNSWTILLSSAPKKMFNTISISVTDSAGNVTSRTVYLFIKPTLTLGTIQVTNITTSSITVAWSKIDSCDRYILFRSDNGTTFSSVKDTVGLGYTDNLVEMGKEYWYKVKGYYFKENLSDTSGFSNTANGVVKAKFEKMYPFTTISAFGATKALQTLDGGYLISGYVDGGGILLKLNAAGEKMWSKDNINENGICKFVDVIYSQDNNSFIILAADTVDDLVIIKADLNGNISSSDTKKLNMKNYSGDKVSILKTSDGGYIVFGSSNDNTTRISKLSGTLTLLWEKSYSLEFGRSCNRGIEVSDGYIVNCYCANGFIGIFKLSTSGDSLFFETSSSVFSNGGIAYNLTNSDCFFLGQDFDGLVLFNYKNISGGLNKEYEKKLNFRGSDKDLLRTIDGGYIILSSIDDSLTYLYKLDAIANSTPQWAKTIENKASAKRIIQTKDNGYLILGTKANLGQNNLYILKVDENGNYIGGY